MLLAQTANGGGSLLITLLPLLLIVALFWFMSRQRKKQMANHASMLTELSPGTRVILGSGIKGTVESVDGDDMQLQIAPGVTVTVLTQAVVRVDRSTEQLAGDDLISDRAEWPDEEPPAPRKES